MRRFFESFLPLLVLGLLLPLLPGPAAADWDQWRGPGRDGVSAGEAWPARLDGLERMWRVELGKGYPGPIVVGERVFVVESTENEDVAVRALDRASGRELWKAGWPSSGDVPFFARSNGDWVRSTPSFADGLLFVGDMNEVLVALDGENGEVAWRVDFKERYGTKAPDFGFASSPLPVDGALYVQAANSLVKLDAKTGESLWRSLESPSDMSASGAFSSPVMATLAGVEQLVVLTREALYGVDPGNGKVLWSQPVPNFRGMNILTPVVHGDSVFTSPYKNGSFSYAVSRTEDGFAVKEAWTNTSSAYMSSPVVIDGNAYLHLGNQRVECVDLATGEPHWRSESFGKYWSMVARGDRILALDSDGELLLLEASPEEMKLLDRREIADQETWGYLAVSGDQLFVRELEGIAAYRLGDAPD